MNSKYIFTRVGELVRSGIGCFQEQGNGRLDNGRNEVQYGVASSLHVKLQKASEELTIIKIDEKLLDWPLTDVPTLPALIQLIEHYYQLWHVAYKLFHQSHDVWFHGNRFSISLM